MKEFLMNYWFVLLISMAFVGYIVYLAVNRRWTRLREIAYKFIRQAEKVVTGSKMGQERFELVLDQLYNLVPPWLRLFVPKALLKIKLQQWFNTVKDSLDDGEINNSAELPDIIE